MCKRLYKLLYMDSGRPDNRTTIRDTPAGAGCLAYLRILQVPVSNKSYIL